MADHTFASGEALTATNLNTYTAHTGGTWNTFTPTVTQSGSVPITTTRGTYFRAGRFIHASAYLGVTGGGGVASNSIIVTLPVTSAALNTNTPLGTGYVFDSSAGAVWLGVVMWVSTTTVAFLGTTSSSNSYLGVAGMTAALAAADTITYSICYEAASG